MTSVSTETAPTHDAVAGDAHPHERRETKAGQWMLMLGSLGVVYGDIGTSPIYALRESLLHTGASPSRDEIIGVTALLIWALILVVTIKYVVLILRADNEGEGGTLALMGLAQRGQEGKRSRYLLILGVIGAALFYGDSILTPAVSVLSAVEGLKVASPAFEPYLIPLALGVLFGLYAVQSSGTARVAAWFGPIMLIWFVTLAGIGLVHIFDDAAILNALNPAMAVWFMTSHGLIGFTVLGSVFLAVTGAEALYADMGHFGRRPIRLAWLCFVFPALCLTYLGQGALALSNPAAIGDLFFLAVPEWARLPMVALATAAAVIASQAVISGAFSLTRQAINLGLLPRLEVRHTSDLQLGQIYMSKVNWLMLAGAVLLVVTFRTSGNLAAAYGIAVTGVMVVTSLIAVVVAARVWRWGYAVALLVFVPFLIIDTTFLVANLTKLMNGGYLPLLLGGVLTVMMLTWVRGRRVVFFKTRDESIPIETLLRSLSSSSINRVPGTAVFLTPDPEVAPTALLHNLKHNKVLHERNLILTVRTRTWPYVRESERFTMEEIAPGFTRVILCFGFMEEPNVPRALGAARASGLKFDIMATSFFIGRRSFRPSERRGEMPVWQDRLFIVLTRQAADVTAHFHIPSGRSIELGSQVAI